MGIRYEYYDISLEIETEEAFDYLMSFVEKRIYSGTKQQYYVLNSNKLINDLGVSKSEMAEDEIEFDSEKQQIYWKYGEYSESSVIPYLFIMVP